MRIQDDGRLLERNTPPVVAVGEFLVAGGRDPTVDVGAVVQEGDGGGRGAPRIRQFDRLVEPLLVAVVTKDVAVQPRRGGPPRVEGADQVDPVGAVHEDLVLTVLWSEILPS
ncbi:hypothetical protein ACQEVZ_27825 [Dactylosporangium sp. CA-152071]|uniref:hypothetical protein n=1 Tax=Dactylosporangium sp. CA-152071 TaxID=3239933 RepID=UPI003D90DBB2